MTTSQVRAARPNGTPADQGHNKFPLTYHRGTGQYCKKIRGRQYYFGTDKHEALRRYHEQASKLHIGGGGHVDTSQLTMETLCNLYPQHQETEVKGGGLSHKQFHQCTFYLTWWAEYIGRNTLVADVKAIDIQGYRSKLILEGKAGNTVNNYVSPIKAMFNWALDNEILKDAPNLRAVKKVKRRKVDRQIFTKEEIGRLLQHADGDMRAMILLGLNCGFGDTDCALLEWKHLDLHMGRADYPRRKTGVPRGPKLWPETIAELRKVRHPGELVFR